MRKPKATRHSKKRIKERMGLTLKSSDRQASLALERGLYHKDMKGRLHKWVSNQSLVGAKGKHQAKYVIYNRRLFIFDKNYENLITAYDVPQYFHRLIDAQSNKIK